MFFLSIFLCSLGIRVGTTTNLEMGSGRSVDLPSLRVLSGSKMFMIEIPRNRDRKSALVPSPYSMFVVFLTIDDPRTSWSFQRRVDLSSLSFSLSPHRHSYMSFIQI